MSGLALCWRADGSGDYRWLDGAPADAVVVAFDALAGHDLRRTGRDVRLFDDLLSWDEMSALELRVDGLLERLAGDEEVGRLRLGGHSIAGFAEYELRHELNYVFRGFELARRGWGDALGGFDPATPSALLEGIRAGGWQVPVRARWLPVASLYRPPSRADRVAAGLVRAGAAASRTRDARVAVVPTMKAGMALAATDRRHLQAARVALMAFPWLDHGNAVRLAVKRHLPLLNTLTFASPGGAEAGGPRVALPLDDDPGLDAALRRTVEAVYAHEAPRIARCAASLRGLDAARGVRALVLPTTASGPGRLLTDHARSRGLTVAAVQHGVYAHRNFDGGDRRADVLMSWSAQIEEQTRAWPEPRPRYVPVGAAGIPHATRPAPRELRRLLVGTTWSSGDTMLAPISLSERFLEVIAPGLRRLRQAGVEVALRIHPAEGRRRYTEMFARLGLDLPFDDDGDLAAALARCDMLVSSTSSIAFEAAALAVPVVMWVGGTPPAIAERHLLPPWAERRPGIFGDAHEFDALAAAGPERLLAVAVGASEQLGRYIEPFDPERFGRALEELAA